MNDLTLIKLFKIKPNCLYTITCIYHRAFNSYYIYLKYNKAHGIPQSNIIQRNIYNCKRLPKKF